MTEQILRFYTTVVNPYSSYKTLIQDMIEKGYLVKHLVYMPEKRELMVIYEKEKKEYESKKLD